MLRPAKLGKSLPFVMAGFCPRFTSRSTALIIFPGKHIAVPLIAAITLLPHQALRKVTFTMHPSKLRRNRLASF